MIRLEAFYRDEKMHTEIFNAAAAGGAGAVASDVDEKM